MYAQGSQSLSQIERPLFARADSVTPPGLQINQRKLRQFLSSNVLNGYATLNLATTSPMSERSFSSSTEDRRCRDDAEHPEDWFPFSQANPGWLASYIEP